jgi:hypothetical protein
VVRRVVLGIGLTSPECQCQGTQTDEERALESQDLGIEIRELLFGKRRGRYRLLFQIRGRTVDILRIWHSARDTVARDDL